MATITKTNTFTAATDVRADKLMKNFNELADFINASVMGRGATKFFYPALLVPPSLPAANPTLHTHAVRKTAADLHPYLHNTASLPINGLEYGGNFFEYKKIAFGVHSGTTDATGYITIPFGYSFPYGLYSVHCMLINKTGGNNVVDNIIDQYTRSSARFATWLANTSVSVAYWATGS